MTDHPALRRARAIATARDRLAPRLIRTIGAAGAVAAAAVLSVYAAVLGRADIDTIEAALQAGFALTAGAELARAGTTAPGTGHRFLQPINGLVLRAATITKIGWLLAIPAGLHAAATTGANPLHWIWLPVAFVLGWTGIALGHDADEPDPKRPAPGTRGRHRRKGRKGRKGRRS